MSGSFKGISFVPQAQPFTQKKKKNCHSPQSLNREPSHI